VRQTRSRRRYRVLRIPKVVVEHYLTSKSGRSIQIEVPQRAERSGKTEQFSISPKRPYKTNAKDRKAYQRIAARARLLAAHVPESRWAEVLWFDDED
jgi:hypothetical protein